jgi:hypothetical protein
MENKNLKLNLLTFDFHKKDPVFYFSEIPQGYCKKLHFSNYPQNIEEHFPGITADRDRKLYTTFETPEEGYTPLTIEQSSGNYPLLKRHYNRWLRHYFRKLKKQLVKTGFVDETQIWLPKVSASTVTAYDEFEKYSLKIQFCQVSPYPELIISFDGISKILKSNVADIIEKYGSKELNWIWHNNTLRRYSEMVETGFSNFEEARPVLNLQLAKAMELAVEIPRAGNPYPKHFEKINSFITSFLNNEQFLKKIPLHSTHLFSVAPARCSRTSAQSNLLLFGDQKTNRVPYMGLNQHGPFQPPKWKDIHLFYIVHEADTKRVQSFHEALFKGMQNYGGLRSFVKVNAFTNSGFSIKFANRSNPIPEVTEALLERKLKPDVRYIALYISPWGKYEPSASQNRIYYQMKELLLTHNITMQTIESAKINTQNFAFQYSLTNIALAMLAKLDGIPWRLSVPGKKELIIGVGAFRHIDTRTQYLGSAFSFDNNGSFNRFEHFLKHETRLLAGSIATAVRQFVSANQEIDRLIIHFYKTMSQKELQPIEDALHNLNLKIPVFVVSINKTESHDITGFDLDYQGLMPLSGSSINIGRNRFLLFNNTRYDDNVVKITDGFPFPVKLAIDCTDKSRLGDTRTIAELIEQVYQFSRLYYKSVRQQGLPVTIKYPEILAGMVPRFSHNSIPVFGLDTLWFL